MYLFGHSERPVESCFDYFEGSSINQFPAEGSKPR